MTRDALRDGYARSEEDEEEQEEEQEEEEAIVAGCSCKLPDSRLTTGDVSRRTNIASAGVEILLAKRRVSG